MNCHFLMLRDKENIKFIITQCIYASFLLEKRVQETKEWISRVFEE